MKTTTRWSSSKTSKCSQCANITWFRSLGVSPSATYQTKRSLVWANSRVLLRFSRAVYRFRKEWQRTLPRLLIKCYRLLALASWSRLLIWLVKLLFAKKTFNLTLNLFSISFSFLFSSIAIVVVHDYERQVSAQQAGFSCKLLIKNHSFFTGIQKVNSKTVTSVMLGEFKKDPKTRDEFFRLVRTWISLIRSCCDCITCKPTQFPLSTRPFKCWSKLFSSRFLFIIFKVQ